MKILDQNITKEIITTNVSHDSVFANMAKDEDLLVIHPNLPNSVLEFIDWDIEHDNFAVRWNSGRGWIAKKFPREWNNKMMVIDVHIPPINVEVHPLAKEFYLTMNKFTPEGWNLNYKHVWLFKEDYDAGIHVPAITMTFLKTAEDTLEVDTISTINQYFDVFFISYDEPNAEENFKRLQEKRPDAKRIQGIRGIFNAHKEAAKKSSTDMFYVVDGDAYLYDDFNFDLKVIVNNRKKTYIWHSYNPVNGLEYGYGGVKLFPKDKFLGDVTPILDVATSIGPIEVVPNLSCETRFNTSAFNAWKSGFREVVKIGSRKIRNQKSEESNKRIETWTSQMIEGVQYGQDCINGSIAGIKFLYENRDYPEDLDKINDYEWLKNKFIELNDGNS